MPAYTRAHVMKFSTIVIDGIEYNNQLTKVRLVPDAPIQTLRVLVPDGILQDSDSATWTLEVGGLQDRGPLGFAKAMDDAVAAQEQLTMTLQPKVGSGQDVATVLILPVPVEFGGEQGNWRTFETNFAVIGQPVFSQSA